jgi:hypothetical protein
VELNIVHEVAALQRLTVAGSEVGCRQGNAEPHRVAIGNQNVARAAGLSTKGNDSEPTSEERVGRIGYFDFIGRYESRVLERGRCLEAPTGGGCATGSPRPRARPANCAAGRARAAGSLLRPAGRRRCAKALQSHHVTFVPVHLQVEGMHNPG